MNLSRTLHLPSVVVLLLLLTACSDETGSTSDARRYVHSMDNAPASLDPAQASSIYANFLVVNLYDTLYRYRYLARPYDLAPNLASDFPTVSDDGLTLTIPLKKGVRFQDDEVFEGGIGREVTANDVVYSLQRHFDPNSRAQGGWLWQGRIEGLDDWKSRGAKPDVAISGLRALDDHTLLIKLTQPYPQFVHTLATGYSAVVPREAVDTYGLQLGSRSVGSGPYKLVSIDSARAILERHSGFRQEPFSLADEGYDSDRDQGLGLEALEGRYPPFLDQLEVEFIAEDASRWNAFYSGQTQFAKVPVAQFDRVLGDRQPPRARPEIENKFHFEAVPESGFVYTNFNMADPSIGYHPDKDQANRNRALRCAIIKGFNWQARNERFFYGIGEVFPGIIPPRMSEYDPTQDDESIRFDPVGARELLSTHGWTADNLPTLQIGFPASVTERQMFEQFRSFMKDIGYPEEKIQSRVFATFGEYVQAYSRREISLITTSWIMDYPDAENTIQLFYGPNASPGSNSSNFDDPLFNEKYRASSAMSASPERTKLYRDMSRIVVDECATLSGLSRTLVFLWDRDVIMRPDRSFVGGFYFRFVDIRDHDTP